MSNNEPKPEEGGIKSSISSLGQQIIGEIELIGGVLTGDPITQAEGEFNVEIGTVREEVEEDIAQNDEESNRSC